jgi:hypothetical protein
LAVFDGSGNASGDRATGFIGDESDVLPRADTEASFHGVSSTGHQLGSGRPKYIFQSYKNGRKFEEALLTMVADLEIGQYGSKTLAIATKPLAG